MSDRELLELAAKAAGKARSQWDYEWLRGLGHMVCRSDMWSPLTDDGDALRLAVKLSIDIEFFGSTVYAGPRKTAKYAVDANCDLDMPAATRRAIVRAAAEIGRTIQPQ